MPNVFKSVLVRRFLAHSLEISVTFALSLITLSLVNYIFSVTNLKISFYDTGLTSGVKDFPHDLDKGFQPKSDSVPTDSRGDVSFIYDLIVLFTLYYFVFTAFNFFVSFTMLYPSNDYKVGTAYKMFGFTHFEFGKKKLSHFKKSLKIVYREFILAISIYGLYIVLSVFNIQIIIRFMSGFMGYGNSLLDLMLTVFYLFCIFVLPALILSLITLKKTKGKQLFWDYISGVTMK